MYSFEGDFRRKPQQNLAGASAQRKTDRDSLIQQSQQQRQKREVNIWYLFALIYTMSCLAYHEQRALYKWIYRQNNLVNS